MIHHKQGDALESDVPGNKIIMHVVNTYGGWGKGFVVALTRKWKKPERMYRDWFEHSDDFNLGNAQFVTVSNEIIVANMLAQDGYLTDNNRIPLSYDALGECLIKVYEKAKELKSSIICPHIGCGLAGGNWGAVSKLIDACMPDIDIYAYVIDRPRTKLQQALGKK